MHKRRLGAQNCPPLTLTVALSLASSSAARAPAKHIAEVTGLRRSPGPSTPQLAATS